MWCADILFTQSSWTVTAHRFWTQRFRVLLALLMEECVTLKDDVFLVFTAIIIITNIQTIMSTITASYSITLRVWIQNSREVKRRCFAASMIQAIFDTTKFLNTGTKIIRNWEITLDHAAVICSFGAWLQMTNSSNGAIPCGAGYPW